MQKQVKVINGSWRGIPVRNKLFTVKREWMPKEDAGYVIVHGTREGGLDDCACRIKCQRSDIEYVTGDVIMTEEDANTVEQKISNQLGSNQDFEKIYLENETEEEAMIRINKSFTMYEDIVKATCDGTIRGLIVCGPPGIGKSYTVEDVLNRRSMTQKLRNGESNFQIIKGYASPINIYKALYNFSAANNIIVFDDCDDALLDDTALNILKAALDSGETRTINWLAESRTLKAEEIPPFFDFKGSVIFLTNYDFERTTSQRLKAHMDAMLSRCHYLDLNISHQRDQLLRIKQVVEGGAILANYDFEGDEAAEIIQYIFDNADYLRELSLRMVKKIADLRKARPRDWKVFVESTCLKRQAKYARMLGK